MINTPANIDPTNNKPKHALSTIEDTLKVYGYQPLRDRDNDWSYDAALRPCSKATRLPRNSEADGKWILRHDVTPITTTPTLYERTCARRAALQHGSVGKRVQRHSATAPQSRTFSPARSKTAHVTCHVHHGLCNASPCADAIRS